MFPDELFAQGDAKTAPEEDVVIESGEGGIWQPFSDLARGMGFPIFYKSSPETG
jgi:hypothetical protein